MRRFLIPLALAGLATVAAFELPARVQPAEARPLPGVAPDPALVRAYTACAREAEQRRVSHAEAMACLDSYLRLKLSFLPDVDVEAYHGLDPAARWAINQRGYAAFAAWREAGGAVSSR